MVGSSLKPSCGRHVTPIHSIPYSVAHLWREVYKYYSYIIRGYGLELLPAAYHYPKGSPWNQGELSAKLTEGFPIPPSRLRRATSLFPSGKRRLLGSAASYGIALSKRLPWNQGSCRRQPTEGLTPSRRGARRSPLAEAAPEYRASEAQAGTKTPMKRIKTTFLAN